MADSAKPAKKQPMALKSRKMFFFEKARNFSVLDEGNWKRHGFLHTWAHLVAKDVLGHMGADPPHFHMHTGKIGQSLEVWGFP